MADHQPLQLAAVGLVGALLGAAITGSFNYIAHQRDLDAKMIELSVGILRSEPKTETEPLREWAIDVIDKRAKFSFNEAQRATLLKRELPFRSDGYFGNGFVGNTSGGGFGGGGQQSPPPIPDSQQHPVKE